MSDFRLRFEKRGTSKFISHLDLMQVFRRTFSRANVPLLYSQGYHPHPSVNILLPLPTGFESCCELLDFGLDAQCLPDDFLLHMNCALPTGIQVTAVGPVGLAVKHIAYVEYELHTDLDASAEALMELISRPELIVTKRTKRGESEVNIIQRIRDFRVEGESGDLCIQLKCAAGNDNLNPEYVVAAIQKYLELPQPNVHYLRRALYTAQMEVFA